MLSRLSVPPAAKRIILHSCVSFSRTKKEEPVPSMRVTTMYASFTYNVIILVWLISSCLEQRQKHSIGIVR
jgi:hypothetical protein